MCLKNPCRSWYHFVISRTLHIFCPLLCVNINDAKTPNHGYIISLIDFSNAVLLGWLWKLKSQLLTHKKSSAHHSHASSATLITSLLILTTASQSLSRFHLWLFFFFRLGGSFTVGLFSRKLLEVSHTTHLSNDASAIKGSKWIEHWDWTWHKWSTSCWNSIYNSIFRMKLWLFDVNLSLVFRKIFLTKFSTLEFNTRRLINWSFTH